MAADACLCSDRTSRGGTADTNARSYSWRHAIVRINVINITTGRILVDTSVIERRSIVDSIALDSYGHHTRIRCGCVNRPWDSNGFPTASHAGACAAGGQDRVSHAAAVAIQDDVFHDADFLAALVLNLHADDLARLHIGLCSGALGLRLRSGNRKTQRLCHQ